MGSGDRRNAGWKLAFPENLFVIGTINVDETTYMFSPKVLDRANTIEFRVETSDLPVDAADSRRPVPARSGPPALVAGFLEIASDDEWQLDHAPDFIEGFVEEIRALHSAFSVLRVTSSDTGPFSRAFDWRPYSRKPATSRSRPRSMYS